MIKNRLSWFGYVKRKPLEALVRMLDCIVFSPEKSGRRSSRKTLEGVVKRGVSWYQVKWHPRS